jgi:hypothetical protein
MLSGSRHTGPYGGNIFWCQSKADTDPNVSWHAAQWQALCPMTLHVHIPKPYLSHAVAVYAKVA